MKDLQLYSIMPLDTDHIDELCADIRTQYQNGICTCALFSMPLAPEGKAPMAKVTAMLDQYRMFRAKLTAMQIPCGILIQSCIGHGYPLNELADFQRYVGLSDGKEGFLYCPGTDAFCEFMENLGAAIASCGADAVMTDDDVRLLHRSGYGCACPWHLAEFNRRAGTDFNREELYASVFENESHAQLFIDTQRDALCQAIRALRRGIDRIDPTICGSVCTCREFAPELASALAGYGNPTVIRINNGNYTPQGARYISKNACKTAMQIHAMPADVILAETDTCPQNRYSTGAYSLHSHFVSSLLEGASGAKHWITRLTDFEPESGIAYRKVLAKYSGFYRTLVNTVPDLIWKGCLTPITDTIPFPKPLPFVNGWQFPSDGTDGWVGHVLERMGLPTYFSTKVANAVFLAGESDRKFSDEQILEFLKCPVFLSGESAKALLDRGFGEYLGVMVRPWQGKHLSGEEIFATDTICAAQVNAWELVPTNPAVRVESMNYHTVDRIHRTPLFPAVTVFDNSLGGRVHVFCGTPITEFTFSTAFSFLNQSRKQQLVKLLSECGCLPVSYTGDEEVYLKAADMPDGSLFCALFNIGFDPIETVSLRSDKPITSAEVLKPNGRWTPCTFRIADDCTILDTPAYTLQPVILRLR